MEDSRSIAPLILYQIINDLIMCQGVFFILVLEGLEMICNDFKCVYLDDVECTEVGGECIGEMCENFGECGTCQMLEGPEECPVND